ncbi:hypothetical protein ACLB9X_03360 [Streptomyces sp. 5K101]|uniref:hypothetical protein n=1 Tax=Streptomyces sp. 5K101 TaxID=3390037 RepID=UPI0039751699
MTRPAQKPEREAAAGIAELEGYLLAQSRLYEARVEAEAFADRLPWLTTSQREEVVRLFAEDRIALSRRALAALVSRAGELRQEYSQRYDFLRQRMLCGGLAALLGLVALLLFTYCIVVRT